MARVTYCSCRWRRGPDGRLVVNSRGCMVHVERDVMDAFEDAQQDRARRDPATQAAPPRREA